MEMETNRDDVASVASDINAAPDTSDQQDMTNKPEEMTANEPAGIINNTIDNTGANAIVGSRVGVFEPGYFTPGSKRAAKRRGRPLGSTKKKRRENEYVCPVCDEIHVCPGKIKLKKNKDTGSFSCVVCEKEINSKSAMAHHAFCFARKEQSNAKHVGFDENAIDIDQTAEFSDQSSNNSEQEVAQPKTNSEELNHNPEPVHNVVKPDQVSGQFTGIQPKNVTVTYSKESKNVEPVSQAPIKENHIPKGQSSVFVKTEPGCGPLNHSIKFETTCDDYESESGNVSECSDLPQPENSTKEASGDHTQNINDYEHFKSGLKFRKKGPRRKIHCCSVCDKAFGNFGHLTEHLRTHTGEKPFECQVCHTRRSTKSSLKQHMKVHKAKYPFKCTLCKSSYRSKNLYTTHMNKNHGNSKHSENSEAEKKIELKDFTIKVEKVTNFDNELINEVATKSSQNCCIATESDQTVENYPDNIELVQNATPEASHKSINISRSRTKSDHLLEAPSKIIVDNGHGQESCSLKDVSENGLMDTHVTESATSSESNKTSKDSEVLSTRVKEEISYQDDNDSDGDACDSDDSWHMSDDPDPDSDDSEENLDVEDSGCPTNAEGDEKPFPCPACKVTFKSFDELAVHSVSHDDDKAFNDATDSMVKEALDLLREKVGTKATKKSSLKGVKVKKDKKRTPTKRPRIHQCTLCDRAFQQRDHLVVHVRSAHTGEKPFKCEICPMRHTSKSASRLHVKLAHSSERPFTCPVCQMGFLTTGTFNRHIVKQHPETRNEYTIVVEKKKKKKYERPKKFVCSVCAKGCISRGHLEEHMRTHTGEKPFLCEQCPVRTTTKASLKTHCLIHHSDHRPHICSQCGSSFATLGLLNSHVKASHSKETIGDMTQCSVCGKILASRRSLAEHMASHTDIRACLCTICGKSYKTPKTLSDHIKFVHSETKKHTCDQCGQQFKTTTNLATHRRTHTNERPYACKTCDMTFTQRGSLQRHVKRIHDNVKDFYCSECGKAFSTADSLKTHMTVHTGFKSYHCDCGEQFKYRSQLVDHRKTHSLVLP